MMKYIHFFRTQIVLLFIPLVQNVLFFIWGVHMIWLKNRFSVKHYLLIATGTLVPMLILCWGCSAGFSVFIPIFSNEKIIKAFTYLYYYLIGLIIGSLSLISEKVMEKILTIEQK